VPELHRTGRDERAEDERGHDLGGLREQKEPPPVDPVRERTAEEREGQDRHAADEPAESEEERRARDRVQQVRRGGHLDERADLRDALADPVEREVTVSQRREPGRQPHQPAI